MTRGGGSWWMQVHQGTGQFLDRIVKGAQSHCEHTGTEQDVTMATKRITLAGWQAVKNHYNI